MATDKGLEDVPEGTFLPPDPVFSTPPPSPFCLPGGGILDEGRLCFRPLSLLLEPHITSCAYLTNDGPFVGQIESNYDETVDSFDDMNLKADLLRGGEFCDSLFHRALGIDLLAI